MWRGWGSLCLVVGVIACSEESIVATKIKPSSGADAGVDGAVSDAGQVPDAGQTSDAEQTPDAGPTSDAGQEADAGQAVDAGSPADVPTANDVPGAPEDGGAVDAGAVDGGAVDGGAVDGGAAVDGVSADDAAVDAGPDVPPPECAADADCKATPSPCQAFACVAGACTPVNLADGATCSDDDGCTLGDACAAGACKAGTAKDCNDQQPCTADACDPKTGACGHTAAAGFCSDGNPCTENDTCLDGACKPGVGKSCDDQNPCTADTCDATSGACVGLPIAATCDDSDACTGLGNCKEGACLPGTATVCDDGNPCTDDGCDKAKGCTASPNAAPCSDLKTCLTGTCGNGSCSVGTKVGCDDNNPCTIDTCVAGKGCDYQPGNDGASCGKADACVAAGSCAAGVCKPGAKTDCSDGKLCTDDGCDPVNGCTWLPNKLPCDDGDACTTGDACANGKCAAGVPLDPTKACDDGNVCTNDSCDPTKGCVNAANAAACDDGNACTTGDKCTDKACKPTGAQPCDDGKPCTADGCDPANGACLWTPKAGPCDDGDACTVGDTCQSAQCVPGAKTVCNDGEPCTTDACDATGKCVSTVLPGANALACDGTVAQGVCWKAFTGNNLVRQQAEDACVKWGGHLARIDSADENASVRAVANQTCGGGSAPWIGLNDKAAEGKYVWADGAPMTYSNWSGGEPNDAKGLCGNPDPGEDGAQMLTNGQWNDLCEIWQVNCYVCRRDLPKVACADGGKCLTGGVCTAGKCTGLKQSCDDGNPCTTDSCEVDKGCVNAPVTDGTVCGTGFSCTAGVCALGSQSNPAKSCVELKAAGGKDGAFWLDPDGAGGEAAYQTWCDQTSDGGGWALVMKVDGTKNTFIYTAALWSNKTALAPTSVAVDATEAKLASFWTLPFKELRVGLQTGKDATQWLKLPYTAPSLLSVMADGAYKPWTPAAGKPAWLALVPNSGLQQFCNREGFNNSIGNGGPAQVRIGIIANNENDCNTPDSRLGIGTGGNYCGIDANSAAGNASGCGVNKNIKSFGYVFVR